MTLYFSEKTFTDEIVEYLRKDFPRGELSSNSLNIARANTIDGRLFLKYFDCAVAHSKDLFTVMVSIPEDLEGSIPTWFAGANGEVMIDPNSGPKGKNIYGEGIFTLKFSFYVDNKRVTSFDETKTSTVEDALAAEFIEIRHLLIDRNNEPLSIFRSFYMDEPVDKIHNHTTQYLYSVLRKKA